MKYFSIISLSFFFTLLSGCEVFDFTDEEDTPDVLERRDLPRELEPSEEHIVHGAGKFGFDLFHELIGQSAAENHFISPLSIIMAYGMTMNGAEGDTYDQMAEVFGLEEMDRDEINSAALGLIELLTDFDEDVQFNIANSIWYRDTFDVESDFLDTNEHYFDATIEPADFDDPETVAIINQWVEEQTEGLIDKIVEDPIDDLTMMYLINAIYFNGDWSVAFDPDDTTPMPFHFADGSEADVDMMRLLDEEGTYFTQGEDYQAVKLYYGDAGFAMTLVLPDEDTDVNTWVQEIDWSKWTDLTQGFHSVTIDLDLPKFEVEYEVEQFGEILQDLGIVDAFDWELSDFSRINPAQEDLHISDTRHKSFVNVDEEGTEAAAVTSVELSVTSANPPEPEHVSIRFDRPFFYMIHEVESNTPLFMGTMNDPQAE